MEAPERLRWREILLLATISRFSMTWLFLRHFPGSSVSLSSLSLENVFIALSLHAGQGFSSPFGVPSGPTACLAPGYPFIIYIVTQLTGTGKAAVLSILLTQIVFSLATVLAVMYLAQRDFGTRVSNLTGLICACTIPMLLAPIWIWDTAISALIVTLFLCIPPRRAWSSTFCFLGGVATGVTGLLNPALLPSIVLICAWHLRHARAKLGYFLLVLALVILPWIVRNYVVLHSVIPVRDSFGFELWMGNYPANRPAVNPKSSAAEMKTFLEEGEIKYMRSRGAEARHYIESAPAAFLRRTGDRILQFWDGSSAGQLGVMFTALGLGGLMLLRSRCERWILYAIPIGVFPLPYYITHAEERYRYVIDPLLVVLSANCLTWLIDRLKRKPLTAAEASWKAEIPA